VALPETPDLEYRMAITAMRRPRIGQCHRQCTDPASWPGGAATAAFEIRHSEQNHKEA